MPKKILPGGHSGIPGFCSEAHLGTFFFKFLGQGADVEDSPMVRHSTFLEGTHGFGEGHAAIVEAFPDRLGRSAPHDFSGLCDHLLRINCFAFDLVSHLIDILFVLAVQPLSHHTFQIVQKCVLIFCYTVCFAQCFTNLYAIGQIA